MNDHEFNSRSNSQKIDGALEVSGDRDRAVIKFGDQHHPVPTLRSTQSELDGFNAFLARTQLGRIERLKQRQLRQIVADAEVSVLQSRTEAILIAHRGLTQAALEEILIAADAYVQERMRDDARRDQQSVQRARLLAAIQFRDHLAQIPEDLPDMAAHELRQAAERSFLDTIERIGSATFRVER